VTRRDPKCPHAPPDDDAPRCPKCGEEVDEVRSQENFDTWWECPECGWEGGYE
jgi:uncharacterized protein with PIN domain